MRAGCYKSDRNTETVSDKYICVNNYGYYEDITTVSVNRERGRVDYQLIYIKCGELIFGKTGEETVLSKGTVRLFRPGEPQQYKSGSIPVSYFWIHFSGCEAERILSFFKEKQYCIGELPAFEHYCRNCAYEGNVEREFSELLNEGRLITLLAKLGEKIAGGGTNDREIKKIRPALDAMHTEALIRYTNEELSQLCALSKDHFLKLFKKTMRVTPHQYYTSLVVNKGRYLLENTSYSIGEIAALCGIDDSLYFSRLFKKHTGLSPREYRNG